jgi:hypothetical protein
MKVPVGGKLNAVLLQHLARSRGGQHPEFNLPLLPERSSDEVQFGIVVARMADKLPGALREGAKNVLHLGVALETLRVNSDAPVRRNQAGCLNRGLKASGEGSKKRYLDKAPRNSWTLLDLTDCGMAERIERIANRSYAATLNGAKEWPKNRRKQVRVLVSVRMRKTESRALQTCYLRPDLAFQLARIETAKHRSATET